LFAFSTPNIGIQFKPLLTPVPVFMAKALVGVLHCGGHFKTFTSDVQIAGEM
jgi:hypothetical protein